jgi:hypothetical protein
MFKRADASVRSLDALSSNTTGSDNTAAGYEALYLNTTGDYNSTYGEAALYSNTSGKRNTASGTLRSITTRLAPKTPPPGTKRCMPTGRAGATQPPALLRSITTRVATTTSRKGIRWALTGSYNIDIGNSTTGVAGESGVIRIGTQVPTALQTNTYIAGIYPNTIANPFPVVIDSTGHLGVGSVS